MSWVCGQGAPRASLSVRTLDSGTSFYRDAKGSDQSQGPLCGPVLRGGGTHPARFWVLGADPNPLLVQNEKVTWDARSVLAAGAEPSVPQSNAQLLSRGPSREASHCRSPCSPGLPSVPLPSLAVSPVRHSAGLPQNTHPERGSQPAGPSVSFPRSSSPPASRPGSFLLAKQRINSQPSNHRKERLQQTLMTTRALFFPSDCLRPSGPGPERGDSHVLLPFPSPLKKSFGKEKVIFS